ncbi:hypothetical protein AB0R99_00045 [Erwinia amylovora]|uniref:hypothetical protein n=1 Tax=Erwinia amylovora TaxID=552 RepID=UPI0037DC294C
MAITPELKQEFYKVLLDQTTPDTQSSILSNPNFVETKDTNYINVIVGFTNLVIVDLIDYKDVKLVFYNATEGSVIGVFDGQDNLIYQIDKHFTNQVSEPLYKFLGVKIDEKTGQIFGLNVVNDKTNFFLFNNIIELIGIVDNALIEAQQFYSTLFNVEDETTPSDAVKIGNKLFANIRTTPETIYGFNLDTQTSFAYSFVINDSDNKKVEFIQFETDLGQVNSNEAT